MTTLDEILASAQRARLIPTVATTRKEERLVSVLLAAMSVVRPLAESILTQCGTRMGKRAVLETYTEVTFPTADGNENRPDGVLRLTTGRSTWTALVEAKVDKSDLDAEQMDRYARTAREFGVDAILTFSNQLVALPTHIPYSLQKRVARHVDCFHISWVSILAEASILLSDREAMDPEQLWTLGEVVRYVEHPSSGVRRFDQMDEAWRPLVLGVNRGQMLDRSSQEVERTVASWHQEERDVCLILSGLLGERVRLRLSRRHQAEPETRVADACQEFVDSHELHSSFVVPNAAGDIGVRANLQRRTIACAMRLDAPGDRKRATARINWLGRQLRGVDPSDIELRAFWRGRAGPTQASLADVLADPRSLEGGRTGSAPTSFEVSIVKDLAGRFSGRKTFVEDLEKLVPEFYERIGQRLRPWTPPPPPIERQDSGSGAEAGARDGGEDGGGGSIGSLSASQSNSC